MRTPVRGTTVRVSSIIEASGETEETLRCYDCNVNFTSEHYLLGHLLHHIKQPSVLIRKLPPAPPIKLTFKSRRDNNFEIISSPTSTAGYLFSSDYLAEESQVSTGTDNSEVNTEDSGTFSVENLEEHNEMLDEMLENTVLEDAAKISFSPNFAEEIIGTGSPNEPESAARSPAIITELNGTSEERTPPNESPSPTEYPKIRIKTTGLLKEPLTITEITEDNPTGEYRPAEIVDISNSNENNNDSSNFWSSCLEDPLKLPDSDRDDNNLLSSFLNNNNDQAKAFGITTDSEFISLDRLDDRNRSALQVYNPSTSTALSNTSLDNLTGLPMQQLAEQVSRLQPSGGNGMHQQNVLINIQQFPQAPPQPSHGYQHPPIYPHPPHPGMSSQPPPLYQPYQYQPSPMYYPPQPNYPPAPHMQPPPQMQQPNQQMPQQSIAPHPQQQSMPPPQPPQYRQQPMPPRPPAPRQFNQQPQRGPAPRAPMAPRQRAPMVRTRGGGMVGTAVRGPRPRMPMSPGQMNGSMQNNQQQQGQRIIKRTPEQIQSLQAKKKRMDVLVPDKNDDADCQVISMQPKNTDGMPIIQSVQGGTPDPADNVMHLSDSITLSVRNPPPKVESPKKSDAKVVANILATRGITVTASAKPKEKQQAQTKDAAPSVAINLNSAVSIIPTAKNNPPSPSKSPANDTRLPTVDLTDDSIPDAPRNAALKQVPAAPQKNGRGAALPFRCDLCPAQYPTLGGLSKHRQSYHKTGSPCEIGIPLIDLKQPGIVQKLTNLGITNFIPMPSSTPDGHFALPVVTLNAARNSAVCNLNALGASSILTLGPVRTLPKPQVNNSPVAKQ